MSELTVVEARALLYTNLVYRRATIEGLRITCQSNTLSLASKKELVNALINQARENHPLTGWGSRPYSSMAYDLYTLEPNDFLYRADKLITKVNVDSCTSSADFMELLDLHLEWVDFLRDNHDNIKKGKY